MYANCHMKQYSILIEITYIKHDNRKLRNKTTALFSQIRGHSAYIRSNKYQSVTQVFSGNYNSYFGIGLRKY